MLEVTKKRNTKNIQKVRYIGSAEKIGKLDQLAKSLGLVDVSDSIPWRELFPEFDEKSSPSIALRGARRKENLTQKELAHLTGIPQGHISEMENSRRTIGKESAKRLGKSLNISYKVLI
ncbi:MAG: helix-turn-helix transcriptional regulator [Deltaproteobacteria bacterium]|nr:helix-turn-helix transcriptional regulator [Deltaproteobacteria bacterium]MBW2195834.1 helix-turn-helix transcriptional regulator [Deltaproteobacteria bacterium]